MLEKKDFDEYLEDLTNNNKFLRSMLLFIIPVSLILWIGIIYLIVRRF